VIKGTIKTAVGALGYEVRRKRETEQPLPDLWELEPDFEIRRKEIEDRTLVTTDRIFMLWQFARHANALPGDVAELGVYRGGTARVLSRTCPTKQIHLFDTFEGMPEVDPDRDVHEAGDFADTSLEAVQEFLSDCPNVRFHQGFFPGTAAGLEDERFSLAYIDADIYQSTRDALTFFYPRMVIGGVMVFDDYEWPRCPGVRQAIDEFLADKSERQIVTTRYQAALIKT
jgi:O-methyltransferase